MKNITQFIYEGFFNNLFKVGRNVSGIVSSINAKTKHYGEELDVEPKFAYDAKQKLIIYNGEDNSIYSLFKGKPVIRKQVPEWLNDEEYKAVLNLFLKTAYGKALQEKDPKYIEELNKLRAEEQKKLEKDPEYQGGILAKKVCNYFHEEAWKNKGDAEPYITAIINICNKFGNDSKFAKKYEEAIALQLKTRDIKGSDTVRNSCANVKGVRKYFDEERRKHNI